MTVYNLEGHGPASLDAGVVEQLLKSLRLAPSEQAGASRMGQIGRSGGAQLAPQALRFAVRDGQAFGVHNRLGEARPYERIANVVHVDEAVNVRVTIDLGPDRAQFLEGVRTERCKRQESASPDHPARFLENGVGIARPLQH